MTGGLRQNSFVLVLCLLLTTGCSSKGTVTGKVSYQGQTLKGGTVVFVPEGGGGVFRSTIAEDGAYTVAKVPPGLAKITVETKSLKPISIPGGANKGAIKSTLPPDIMKDAPPGTDLEKMFDFEGPAKKYVPIPDKYSDPDKSGLTYTVKSGKQEHNIDLK